MKFDPAKELTSLAGKVVIITGSTSGIGFATAQVLVRQGARVYIAARNESKAVACIKRIEDEGTAPGNGQVLYHHLDLADPKEAKKSAEEFLKKEQRLDILINNAAIILEDFKIGSNGVQEIMTVNYFSPFVFTDALLPLLKSTASEPGADVRIVNVASDSHHFAPKGLHFKSKDDFNVDYGNGFFQSMKRYGVSKLLMVLWSCELQRHLTSEGSDIIVISLNPGSILTENTYQTAYKYPWPISSFFVFIARLFFHPPLVGAGTPSIAAAAAHIRAEAGKYKGAYLVPVGKLGKTTEQAQNTELAKELWETTIQLLKEWNI